MDFMNFAEDLTINPVAEEILSHYGVGHLDGGHSGRYPFGSGDHPFQHRDEFMSYVGNLKDKGLLEKDIAKDIGLSTTQLRVQMMIAKHQYRDELVQKNKEMIAQGMSRAERAKALGMNESSVRSLENEDTAKEKNAAFETAQRLEEVVQQKKMIDVGANVEREIGVSRNKLEEAIYLAYKDGYNVFGVGLRTGEGKQTTVKVLADKDITQQYAYQHPDEIQSFAEYHSSDNGLTFDKKAYPASLDSSRVMIRYAEEGGLSKDGTIEIRRGPEDLSMGNSNYAQVRILVDGTHYLKGMATYRDGSEMPDGVDVIFNTNKSVGTPKEKVFKEIKPDPDNPFGAYFDASGQTWSADKKTLSVVNKLKSEGDWNEQAKNVSSQFLSKQPQQLINKQLNVTYGDYEARYDEIMSLTNSTLRKKMLLDFAGECDSAAVSMKASAFPRQRTQVILPLDGMKDTEVYAPNFKDGEEVILIRYPHGGTFEIPRLKVNNKSEIGQKILGPATTDAIGINANVASQLSGADFDGDTVVVIPTKGFSFHTRDPLPGLKGFDPKEQYKKHPGMKILPKKNTQREMGIISNLITDMTLGGAPDNELERAVKHSMVIIDAAKHELDYKQSEIDNGIAELKKKWQIRVNENGEVHYGGASTLLSRRKQTVKVPETRGSGIVNKETGEVTYKESGRTYFDKKTGQYVRAMKDVSLVLSKKDVMDLSSGTPQEKAYAEFSNRMKALANKARKEYANTPPAESKPSAKLVFADAVEDLKAKLDVAERNAPKERRAQAIANGVVKKKIEQFPDLLDRDNKKELNRVKSMALNDARISVGASGKNSRIILTNREWDAIQAGALSDSFVQRIFRYCDQDNLKERALPKTSTAISAAKQARITNMRNQGYTNAQIAEAVGVSISTVTKYATNN